MPLMGPALATCAIFTFIWTWSDFFTPLIYLTDPNSYTVPVALKGFVRFALGEGVEKKVDDFAAEVASMTQA